MRHERIGRPLYPGTMVLTRPRCVPQPASAAFQRPVPDLGPALHSFQPDLQDDGASTKGFTLVRPPVLLLARGPRKERGPFGLNPGLRTPQSPATHAREETGDRARAGDHVIINRTPPAVIHSPHATSCRTRSVLPSMASTRRPGSVSTRSTFAPAARACWAVNCPTAQPATAASSAAGSVVCRQRRSVASHGNRR